MKSILEKIIQHKKAEIELRKQQITLQQLMEYPHFEAPRISLKKHLENNTGVIAEMKRKSPSAGILYADLNPSIQAIKYKNLGACAISVLTDQSFFGGSLTDLKLVKQAVDLPLLQKDFIVDEYQLFEAKAHGADIILLIAAILTPEKCLHLSIIAKSLQLEVILEVHAEHELCFINEEVDFIMVNNRDLHIQETNINHSLSLLPYLPKQNIKISASGIQTAAEVDLLHAKGYKAVLIGESILKHEHLGRLTKKQAS